MGFFKRLTAKSYYPKDMLGIIQKHATEQQQNNLDSLEFKYGDKYRMDSALAEIYNSYRKEGSKSMCDGIINIQHWILKGYRIDWCKDHTIGVIAYDIQRGRWGSYR